MCKGLEHFREALYAEPVVDAPSRKDESTPSTASPVAEATADKEFIVSADTTADHETRTSVQKSFKYVMADGEDLFKSLFSAEKTPPTSPGSVASSSTAVDPSSRKVSPSGSDIKDFANSSSDKNHVLDPTAITEENTKKQLLEQLKKKTATEEKASRKDVKLAARNEALNAELKLANATVQNRDTQTEFAKTIANAMILSNAVLRHTVQDLGLDLSREDNGPSSEGSGLQGETTESSEKNVALQAHLRLLDEMKTSAGARIARLQNPSAKRGHWLDGVRSQATNPHNIVKDFRSESSVDTLEGNKPAVEGSSPDTEVDEHPAPQELIKDTMPTNDAILGLCTGIRGGTNEIYEFPEPAGPATLWGILQSNQTVGEFDIESNQNEASTTQEPISNGSYGQDMDCGRGGDVGATYEFSEPAGPATMWGILQSNQTIEETGLEGDHTKNTAAQDPITDETEILDHVKAVDNGWEGGLNQDYEFSEPSDPATLRGTLQSSQYEFSEWAGPATLWGILQSSQCDDAKDDSALTVGEPGPGSDSNESPADEEPGAQEPETQEPEVDELTTDLVQDENHTQCKADAGEEAAPEVGGPAPQAKDFRFIPSEIDMNGAEGGLDEPQSVSEMEIPKGHEAASTLMEKTHDDFGNDEKTAEQGTANGDVLNIQSENNESTIVQGQDDSGLTDFPLDKDSSHPLDKDNDLSRLDDLEEEIITPANSPDTSDTYIRNRDGNRGETHQSSEHSDTSTELARTHSLPEPEIFDFPCTIPKPKSKSEAEIKEKKKAEHKRYKAKKKAEAAAKRRLEEEEEEVAEEMEAPEPPKTLAQSQAEEDARLGDRRMKLQAKRQEQQEKAASLRGVVRSSRGHLIY